MLYNKYRYAFNGMERDDEVKGTGNSYDFGARIYDSRIGRWLSVDPKTKKYPALSPYNFVGNMPIIAIDPNGEEIWIVLENGKSFKYTPGIEPKTDNKVVQDFHKAVTYITNTEKGTEVINDLHQSEGVVRIHLLDPKFETGQKIGDQNKFVAGGEDRVEKGEKRLIGDVYWEVYSDMKAITEEGGFVVGVLVPSTGLLHEAGHAQRYDKAQKEGAAAVKQYKDDLDTEDPDYGNLEERRNITEVEHKYIEQINDWVEKNSDSPQKQPKRKNNLTGDNPYWDGRKMTKDVNKAP